MKTIRAKYQTHIAAMFRLAGLSDPEARATRVLALETAIAQKQISLEDSEDIHKANNPWHPADFTAKAPGLDWPEFFRAAALEKQSVFIVWQPSAFTGEAALVASQPIDAWKDLLAYHLIEDHASAISKAMAAERFAFFGTTLNGIPQQRPRDFRGHALVSAPSAIPSAKSTLSVSSLLKPRRRSSPWSPTSSPHSGSASKTSPGWPLQQRRKPSPNSTHSKSAWAIPTTGRATPALNITPDNLFTNLWNAGLFEYQYSLGRIGQPTDRNEWCMDPADRQRRQPSTR